MVTVDERVHTLSQQDGATTRVRIYFYSGDCTDDTAVQTNGTLLKFNVSDTDSNGRISATNGLSFNEYFNKEEDITIGLSASSTISASLVNTDGGLDSLTYGKCKVYIDIYDYSASEWVPCPMGVYIIDVPTKRRKSIVNVSGNDCMKMLDAYCDAWWNGITWPMTMYQVLNSLATNLSLHLSTATQTNMLNGAKQYLTMPFSVGSGTTYRDIVEYIAEASGCIARFDRNGYLELAPFTATEFEVDCDAMPTPCMEIDIAEYSVHQIDKMYATDSYTSITTDYGEGGNAYQIRDNMFINSGASIAYMDSYCTDIFNRLSAISQYTPVEINMIADYSVQAGDIITVTYGGTDYEMPIFQSTMTWNGGWVMADYMSFGNATRAVEPKSVRSVQELTGNVHEMTNTIEQYSSRFESVEGDVSEITQNLQGLSATVASQGTQLDAKMDSASASLVFTELRSEIAGNTDAIETNQANLERYIRFVNGSIVLGASDSEIKLKLKNNIIYFFSGDDSADESNAIAYFDNNQLYVTNVNTEEHMQIGTETGADDVNYQFLKQANGDLILRMV